jgi:hypothetical protein
VRALSEHRTRPVLGELLAVSVYPYHPVQDQVHIGAMLTLPGQRPARIAPAATFRAE